APANPFQRAAFTPLDGSGMNPQLQNPGMVFHPPMLYLGYISITIPFAFAMAALLTKKLDADWLVAVRKWTILSWLFLSIGLLIIELGLSVLWGTLYPIISEWVQGVKVTYGPPTFNFVNIPLGLVLLLLTGIGPLIAWRRASTANLRRQFAVPVTVGVFTLLILLVAGMRDLGPLLAFSFGAFVFGTVFQEFARGARARNRQYGEALPLAVLQLLSRNRRRYGGYIVHIAIVLLSVGLAGMAFET